MSKTIHIKDRQFIQRVAKHARARGLKTLTRTAQQLAEERMTEIQVGIFIPATDEPLGEAGVKKEAAEQPSAA